MIPATGSYRLRRWALMLYWLAMFLATHWPELDRYRPERGWPIPNFEMVMHVLVYAGWVAAWWWLLSAGGAPVSDRAANWLTLGGLLYAAFDELSQQPVDRTPAIDDFVADVVGVIAAVALLRGWQKLRARRRRPATKAPSAAKLKASPPPKPRPQSKAPVAPG